MQVQRGCEAEQSSDPLRGFRTQAHLHAGGGVRREPVETDWICIEGAWFAKK